MTEMMTRFLTMGFILEQVITTSTLNPAKAVAVDDRLGTLGVGKQANISVLKVQDDNCVVYDVVGGARRVNKAVLPVLTGMKGEVFEASWGPRLWGWEPDPA